MSRTSNIARREFEDALKRLPKDGLILDKEEYRRLVAAVGGNSNFLAIIRPEAEQIQTGWRYIETGEERNMSDFRGSMMVPAGWEPVYGRGRVGGVNLDALAQGEAENQRLLVENEKLRLIIAELERVTTAMFRSTMRDFGK